MLWLSDETEWTWPLHIFGSFRECSVGRVSSFGGFLNRSMVYLCKDEVHVS